MSTRLPVVCDSASTQSRGLPRSHIADSTAENVRRHPRSLHCAGLRDAPNRLDPHERDPSLGHRTGARPVDGAGRLREACGDPPSGSRRPDHCVVAVRWAQDQASPRPRWRDSCPWHPNRSAPWPRQCRRATTHSSYSSPEPDSDLAKVSACAVHGSTGCVERSASTSNS